MNQAIEHLLTAIDAVPDVGDADGLRALLAAYDRLTVRVCTAVDRVHRSGGVAADGAVSTAQWLRTHAGLSPRTAGCLLARAKRLSACPVLAEAWHDGLLTSGQVDAVVDNVTDRTEPVLTQTGDELVATLAGLTVRQTGIVVRQWAVHAEALVDAPAPAEERRTLHLSPALDGWGELKGRLDPAAHDVVETALAAAAAPAPDGEPRRGRGEQRADALVAIARFFLDHGDVATTRRRPHVQIVLTLPELARRAGRSIDGVPFDAGTVGALLCDAGVHRIVTDGASVILDSGRITRTVSNHLFSALAAHDDGCRFPGCDRPVSWCEAHHVLPWHDGGETAPANLVLLCWRHHHDFAHHPQWHLKLLPDATVEVTTPDGRVLTSHPTPQRPIGFRAPKRTEEAAISRPEQSSRSASRPPEGRIDRPAPFR